MSAEIVKGPFLSNCLLEAAKAKIRHPFKVKVTVVPRSEARCPHFLWSDGEYDYDSPCWDTDPAVPWVHPTTRLWL